MLFGDYKLEIIANNNPLHEYNLHDSNLNLGISNVLKSHVYMVNERRKEFCEHSSFVAVPKPGTGYEIRVAALKASESNPLIAVVYIDGNNDGRQFNLFNGLDRKMTCFYNKSLTRKHKFIFDITEWVEDVQNVNSKKEHGGLGAISVYFYKAKHIKPLRVKRTKLTHDQDNPDIEIEQTKVPETKKCIDIAYTTKFDEGEIIPSFFGYYSSGKCLGKESFEPLAALHINYRPVDWLMMRVNRELKSESSPSNLFKHEQFKLNLNDQPDLKLVNDNVIKQDNNSQDPIIIISDEDSDDEEIVNKKRKIEVIEILD